MLIRRDFSKVADKLTVFLTIGFFDGVHLGHRKIIEQVVARAKTNNLQSCMVTFDRHPNEFFSGKEMKFLTLWEEKTGIFKSLGIDLIQVFTFNSQFSNLSPGEFLQKLNEMFTICEILVGEEFSFGKGKRGTTDFLYEKQSEFDYRLTVVPRVTFNEEKISSSSLRKWFEAGKIKEVTRGLGRYPTIIGKVTSGKGKGREIGYPTANIQPHPKKLVPRTGVYVGYVGLDTINYRALINIGARPTFEDYTLGIEVHIIDYNNLLYGKVLKIDLVERIRDVISFSSPAHLSRQLDQDKEKASEILHSYSFSKSVLDS